MNDFNTLCKMLEGKVKFKIVAIYDKEINYYKQFYPETDKIIKIENTTKIGFSDLYSAWLFDINGNLITIGHYE